jgi:hypothetical protein
MRAQIGRFSRVASVPVLPDRRSRAVCGGPFSPTTPRTGLAAGSPVNPVPSWHITNGRAGWREGY